MKLTKIETKNIPDTIIFGVIIAIRHVKNYSGAVQGDRVEGTQFGK